MPAFGVADIGFRVPGDKLSLILAMDFAVGIHAHGAEFVDNKNPPVHADALLRIEDRAFRVKLYQQGNQQPEGREQRERKGSNDHVGDPLGAARKIGQRLAKSLIIGSAPI